MSQFLQDDVNDDAKAIAKKSPVKNETCFGMGRKCFQLNITMMILNYLPDNKILKIPN